MTHECDRETDGRTDFAITNAALHYVSRPKIWTADGGGRGCALRALYAGYAPQTYTGVIVPTARGPTPVYAHAHKFTHPSIDDIRQIFLENKTFQPSVFRGTVLYIIAFISCSNHYGGTDL